MRARKKRFHQFTAIDDCTRLRILRIYDRLNQRTAIQFVDYVLEKLPFEVEAIQTDNGSEFQSCWSPASTCGSWGSTARHYGT